MIQVRTLLLMIIFVGESLLCNGACITWDFNETKLDISCKLQERYSTIAVKDNFGKQLISCISLKEEIGGDNCQRFSDHDILAVNYSDTKLMLTIQRNQITDYDGQWTCQVDSEETRANISSLQAVEDEYSVRLEVLPTVNSSHVELRCFSCRDPFAMYAEFLIDNKTADILTYDPTSSNCYHAHDVCRPESCACFFDNHFIRQFTVNLSTPKLFSCTMSFYDTYTDSKFSRTAGIFFDGKDFKPVATFTTVIKRGNSVDKTINGIASSTEGSTHTNNSNNSKDAKTTSTVLLGLIIGPCTGVVVLLCVLKVCRVCRIKSSKNVGEEQNFLHRRSSLKTDIEDKADGIKMADLQSTESETEHRIWLLAGFCLNALNKSCSLYHTEVLAKKQRHDKFKYNEICRTIEQKTDTENVMKNGKEYGDKIQISEGPSKVLHRCKAICSDTFNDGTWIEYDKLLYLMDFVDGETPKLVIDAGFGVCNHGIDWFAAYNSAWTYEKLSDLTNCIELVEEYITGSVSEHTRLIKLRGENILKDARYQNLFNEWRKDLSLLVEQNGRSRIWSIYKQMFELLRDHETEHQTENLNRLTSNIAGVILESFVNCVGLHEEILIKHIEELKHVTQTIESMVTTNRILWLARSRS